jgi:CPA1 family monovalent cation:H+ antiporter
MYFISSGQVKVAAANQQITLGRGDFFGEMALLLHQRRQADVVAVTYCQLLVLKDEDFGALLKGNKEIRARIDQVAAERSKMNLEADKGN